MSKSKRNIILIFGFILIINFLFFPCNKIEYSIHYGLQETEKAKESGFLEWLKEQEKKEKLKEKRPQYTLKELLEKAEPEKTSHVSIDYVKVFFPLVISRANKYKKYIKWENSVLLMLEEKIKIRTELEGEYEGLKKGRSTLLTEELFRDDTTINRAKKKKGLSQLAKVNIKIYEIDEEIKATYEEKNKEFQAKFGDDSNYHQIRIEFFFIEPILLILIGLIGYVLLRKIREWRADRIKGRKAGIILILIGIGIPLALAPFVSRGWVDILEIEFKYFLFIGIVLFLIGTGKVIFSFFPKDTNSKK